jgi:uncharacterized spore protein YtfJ
MTTDYKAATDYRAATGYDDAFEQARLAGDGGSIDGFVERMAERVGGKASVRAVFGDPIERDGITVIPVAKVRWGFGGGAGRGPIAVGPGVQGPGAPELSLSEDIGQSGAGSGGGGGVTADPIGYLEIGPDGANFRPITPVMPSPGFLLAAGVTAMLVLRGLAKLIRR